MVKYINSAKRKRIAQLASFVAILVFGFSVIQFYQLFQKDQFVQKANSFIQEMKNDGISIIDEDDKNINYDKNSIKLVLYGKTLNSTEIEQWEEKLTDYGLPTTTLNIQQGTDDSDIRAEVQNLTDLYSRNQQIISSRDEKIKQSEDKIKLLEAELNTYYKVPFSTISQEAKINYTGLKTLSYANVISTNFKSTDTLVVFTTTWYDSIPNNNQEQEQKLKDWLKIRLSLDTLKVVRE